MIVDRFRLASAGFQNVLRFVQPHQWTDPTPCAEWDVRALVNHMTRGNSNYVQLVEGGSAADFLRLRDADALGADPVGAYTRSVAACAAAFEQPGALDRRCDYPLGRAPGRQLLAVRTTDTLIHTWDLARALDADETLDPTLVAWASDNLAEIYGGLTGTSRFFGPPVEAPESGTSRQDRLLRRMGRQPEA